MTEELGENEIDGREDQRTSNIRRKFAVGVAAQALREGWTLDESFREELADILDEIAGEMVINQGRSPVDHLSWAIRVEARCRWLQERKKRTRPMGEARVDVATLLGNSPGTVEKETRKKRVVRTTGKTVQYSVFARELFDNYEQHIQPNREKRLKYYDELFRWKSDTSPLAGEGQVRYIEDLLVYKISEGTPSGK